MNTEILLRELTAAQGVAGRESQIAALLQQKLTEYGTVSTTPLGSVLCRLSCGTPGAPVILLDAHIDQIGMIVTHLEDNGFLRIAPVGGMDRRVLPAARVTVHTEDGDLPGVVCSTPPHLAGKQDDKVPAITELYIDTGLSTEEARQKIACGDIVTVDGEFRGLCGDLVLAPALDNRAGCAALLLTAEMLRQERLDTDVVLAFNGMEETGSAGAATAANLVQATAAIVVDATFGVQPGVSEEKAGRLHGGPMIGIAPILNRQLTQQLIGQAKENGIPYQIEVMHGATGTDADAIAVSGSGVRTATVSVPIRNMHTPVEIVSTDDVENTAKLIALFLKEGLR